jgi:Fe-S oxidoreductase
MRIKPRSIKRHMFTCTQCGQCANACSQVQAGNPGGTLLKWVEQECALDKSARDFGHHENIPEHCFEVKSLNRQDAKDAKNSIASQYVS